MSYHEQEDVIGFCGDYRHPWGCRGDEPCERCGLIEACICGEQRRADIGLEELPLRIVLDWNEAQIRQERIRVAGNIESSQRYLNVLDTALAKLTLT